MSLISSVRAGRLFGSWGCIRESLGLEVERAHARVRAASGDLYRTVLEAQETNTLTEHSRMRSISFVFPGLVRLRGNHEDLLGGKRVNSSVRRWCSGLECDAILRR